MYPLLSSVSQSGWVVSHRRLPRIFSPSLIHIVLRFDRNGGSPKNDEEKYQCAKGKHNNEELLRGMTEPRGTCELWSWESGVSIESSKDHEQLTRTRGTTPCSRLEFPRTVKKYFRIFLVSSICNSNLFFERELPDICPWFFLVCNIPLSLGHLAKHRNRLEQMQHKFALFVRFLSFGTNTPVEWSNHDCNDITCRFNVTPFE